MSFTKEKRDAIRHYLLEKIDAGDSDFISKAAEAFRASDKTIYRYLQEMVSQGILEKSGKKYQLHSLSYEFRYEHAALKSADEDRIYRNDIRPVLQDLPKNVLDIWYYSFTEMMNNAIDHSEAAAIRVTVQKTNLHTTILIYDDGIGIFKKIKDHFGYSSLDDAVEDLFKGKFTTDPEHHTGEGIFFTSHMLDMFVVISNGKLFSRDKFDELISDLKAPLSSSSTDALPGTFVFMRLSNSSNKTESAIFDLYADIDDGFTRTQIPLKSYFETWPVSRSQAKRLCRGFDRFLEVLLDFTDVPKIGQGFAHELFIVWPKNHPGTRLVPVGANEAVQKMISHVLNS